MSNRILFFASQALSKTKQRGSAMLLALFVMIVIMLLGTTLVNILSTSSETIAQEVIGTRALASANSAMQGELQQLFPLSPAVGVCNATANYDFSTINGMPHCSASTTCTLYATNDGTNYFRLESTGECGSGTLASDSSNVVISSRTIQVEARNLK